MAGEYGLADTGPVNTGCIFDYDNDGDLDVYIVTNAVNTSVFPDNFQFGTPEWGEPKHGQALPQRLGDSLKHRFIPMFRKGRYTNRGYGHSVNITDINGDGWKIFM